MAVNPRSDQVFQLSLTEIAFMLIFILLLLLGYLVVREQAAREVAETALAEARSTEETLAALQAAKSELSQALIKAGSAPIQLEETISRLTSAQEIRVERDKLVMQVEDLDAQLSAMTELRKELETVADKQNVPPDEVLSALVLQKEVREAMKQAKDSAATTDVKPSSTKTVSPEQLLPFVRRSISTAELLKKNLREGLGQTLSPGDESKTIEAVVAAARAQSELAKSGVSIEVARKENSDLRGQVAFFKRRLEARGGRDHPPCWANESGAPEYLFSLELNPTGIVVQPAWPAHREPDARSLPNIETALQSPVSLADFARSIQGIFNASKAADPQCRHYVSIKNTIADAVASDRARLSVENYFYIYEARR